MIEIHTAVQCDTKGCASRIKQEEYHSLLGDVIQRPTLPDQWVAITTDQWDTRVYCPQCKELYDYQQLSNAHR